MTTLLTAANGRTGRAVLKALAATGADVKVLIRDERQWPALQELGAASHAVGDMEEASTIDAAMASCDKIIHIGPPMHPNEVEITSRFIESAKAHGLPRFVYYSVMHPLRRAVRHHRLKLDAEEALIESGLPYTIVQPIRYMQHLELIWKKGARYRHPRHALQHRRKVQRRRPPRPRRSHRHRGHPTRTPLRHVRTRRPGSPEPARHGGVISRVLGRRIRAEALSLEQMEKNARAAGAGDDRVTQMLTMNQHYDDYGFHGNPNVLRWILGREPNTFENYVRRVAAGIPIP